MTVQTVVAAATPVAESPETRWAEFTSFTYEGRDPVFDRQPPSPSQYYNPILPGFYPDPDICRAGKDFYLINSSFSYYPGVPIFHSTDLVNWTQLGHVLDRPSQLDLDGLPVSSGIFAPAITHHDGLFYMITTNVRGIGNFYVTAKDPAGPWSDPVTLPEIDGIDPSFFFDDDGRAYIVHNGPPPDNKPLYDGHRAIWLWEFDPAVRAVNGKGRIIVNGGVRLADKPVWIEGPHIFKRNGFYYLCAAEGGTSVNHSQVVFRTRSLAEPFEPFPGNPILTQRDLDPLRPDPVTSLGHAALVDAGNGEWWAVFLGVRPYEGNHYNTGRETFLLPVRWENDWPVILKKGAALPRVLPRPGLPASAGAGGAPSSGAVPLTGSFTWRDDFDDARLGLPWVFLRTPRERWWSLTARPGSLLIAPRPVALHSAKNKDARANGNPSFIARRQQHGNFTAAATLAVNAETAAGEAGLAALQNDTNYFFLGVRIGDGKAREIFLETHTGKSVAPEIIARAPLPGRAGPGESIELRITGAGKDYSFAYRLRGDDTWNVLKENADGRILGTQSAGGFVGAVLGLYARAPQAR
ncbi:glycoside hydrolase family 43 protein [Termitidicoccus mucosus]|uniref:glycoside hydrolase family 43 protein n=1 Tax=Termitidicoccus mucosus TaxID=1184151 RepID=UPI0031B5F5CB